MTNRPRPLAVGLLQIPAHATQRERTRARIALVLRAEDEGYALVETYETGVNGVAEDVAFRALEELAARVEPRAVVAVGDIDGTRLREVAARNRMSVLVVLMALNDLGQSCSSKFPIRGVWSA